MRSASQSQESLFVLCFWQKILTTTQSVGPPFDGAKVALELQLQAPRLGSGPWATRKKARFAKNFEISGSEQLHRALPSSCSSARLIARFHTAKSSTAWGPMTGTGPPSSATWASLSKWILRESPVTWAALPATRLYRTTERITCTRISPAVSAGSFHVCQIRPSPCHATQNGKPQSKERKYKLWAPAPAAERTLLRIRSR